MQEQKEVRAIYIFLILNAIFQNLYIEKLERKLKGYDWQKHRSEDGEYIFTEIVQKIQQDGSRAVKFLIACCNIKIVGSEVKKDMAIRTLLS